MAQGEPPEIFITPWKIRLRGKEAIEQAGWPVQLALVCWAIFRMVLAVGLAVHALVSLPQVWVSYFVRAVSN